MAGGDAGEFVHNASHPANRHFPFSGAVPNEVVKKAAVLEQGRIVRVCEQANLAIGKDNAAQQIVLQVPFNRQTERFLDQAAPRLTREVIRVKLPREFLFATKRTKHRVPDLISEDASESVKFLQVLELSIITCKF